MMMMTKTRRPPHHIPADDWLVSAILALEYKQTLYVSSKDRHWVTSRHAKAKRLDNRADYKLRRFGDTFRITAPMTYYV